MGIRHKRWIQWSLMLAVLFCLVLPSLTGTNLASDGLKKKNDTRLHYIVQFWHADGSHDSKKDKDGYLAKDGDKEIIKVKDNKKKNETFSGFATAAGHSAVEEKTEEQELVISYKENVPLAKVNVFYRDTNLEKEGGETGGEETKIEIKTDEDGNSVERKVYNTFDDGLHTDKTAEAIKDGREFELTLESWFVGNNKANVGMVLDASGSMAFTSENPEPIKVKDDGIEPIEPIPQDKLEKILDSSRTDNSKLSYNNYSYYVYDPDDNTQEFVPIGYWNGMNNDTIKPDFDDLPTKGLSGYYPFNDLGRKNEVEVVRDGKEREEVLEDSEKNVTTAVEPQNNKEDGTEDEDGKIRLSSNQPSISSNDGSGYMDKYKALDLAKTYYERGKRAARLDIRPQNDTFTISFAVKGTNSKPVVWIGNKDQRKKQAWYAIYADSQEGRTKIISGLGVTTEGNDLDTTSSEGVKCVEAKAESNDEWMVCTYVFEKDENAVKVTPYINGDEKAWGKLDSGVITETGDIQILLGGSAWQADYGGDNWEDGTKEFLLDELYFYDTALNEEDVKKLNDMMKKAISIETHYLALAPSSEGTSTAMAALLNTPPADSRAGWYYVSSDSDWESITNDKLLTSKKYVGIPKGSYQDKISKVPEGTKDPKDFNTEEYFEIDNNSPICFYKDKEGYLRCIYNRGSKSYCSYIYEKKDGDRGRTKAEVLQHALSSFVSRLKQISKDSQVSAVRFSTDNIPDDNLSLLVLQDWTSNTMDSTGMLGLWRGDRDAISFDMSESADEDEEPLKQYNYVLTGGTATWTGLKAYMDNMKNRIKDDDQALKSLIIFTDGKDTTGDEGKQKAIEYADQLKEDGYTIYCVMLQSAGVKFEATEEFLNQLASGDKSEKNKYVFSANNVEELTTTFTQNILERIVNNLSDYVIQDYIDPRFDLVDVAGRVIHLNAKGKIIIDDGETEKSIDLKDDNDGYEISVTKITDEDAIGTVGEKAKLFYNDKKGLYYLKWEGQTIPGCSIEADRLNVWKTRIHVKAKEDFIGGNAILTNGNEADMNMVYHKDTKNPSSGKEDAEYTVTEIEDEDGNSVQKIHYPSKGFPRTTVNVKLLDLNIKNDNTIIYMGQNIDPLEQLEYLGGTVDNKVYYEYLERYAKQGASAQQKIEQLKKGEEISILYYYLPDIKSSNQTGGDLHKNDQIGELTYKWIECDNEGNPKGDKTRYELFATEDVDSRYYQLSISYKPLSEDDRDKEEKLITDLEYGYDKDLKAAKGDEQKSEMSDEGTYQTDIVRGELIVEARVLLDDLKYLAEKNDGKLDLKEKFTVERSYDKITKYDYDTIEIAFPTYTTAELDELSPDEDGYVSIYSKPSKPLPIGVYTLKAVEGGTFKFGNIKANNIVNSEDGKGHFTIHEGEESEYKAPLVENSEENSVSFYMGVSPTEGNSEVDLDGQLGHAVVTYELDRPEPTPTAVPTASPSPEPTASPDPTPTAEPTVSPNPEKTPKATKKPKKNTKKPTKISSTPQPNTNIDDKLPTGRKNLGDPNCVPDTRDTAEPAHALLLLILTAVLILSVELKELEKKEKK